MKLLFVFVIIKLIHEARIILFEVYLHSMGFGVVSNHSHCYSMKIEFIKDEQHVLNWPK